MGLEDLFEEFPARDWDSNPDGTVRMAVVGLGGYARNVSLPAIADGDYTAVGAVVSGDAGKADEVAAEYDATPLSYDDYADGRDAADYDGVYVATPNRLHLPHVRTAAEQGKGVICEKPLEATTRRAVEAVRACDAAGVTLMTAYRMQTDPVMRRLREFIGEGGIGDPVKLFGDFTFPLLRGGGDPDQWRLDADLAGGGALLDVGVYPLNTSRFLLGADPVSVSARTSGDGDAFAEVDEHVHFQTAFPGDVVGHFSASFSGHANTTLDIVGSDGRIRVDDAFPPRREREVLVERDGRRISVDGLGADETREEFDYFAHCLLTGTPPEPDGEDGLVDMQVADAVYESAASGRDVTVSRDEPI